MPTATDILRANGILRPDITIAEAAAANLELAAACVMLMGESSGGRMVWGSDGAPSAKRTDQAGRVIYTFGGPVTRDNYLAFRAEQRAGRIPRQGVGDCQLTSEEFVARAEQIGVQRGGLGPWDPAVNQAAGFVGLAQRIAQYGTRDGFRRYNGSGPAAEAYADRSMAALAVWRQRLAGAAAPTPPVKPSGGDGSQLPTLTYGMRGSAAVGRLQTFMRDNYPAYAKTLPTTGNYLEQTADVIATFQARSGITGPDADGRTVGPRTKAALWAAHFRG